MSKKKQLQMNNEINDDDLYTDDYFVPDVLIAGHLWIHDFYDRLDELDDDLIDELEIIGFEINDLMELRAKHHTIRLSSRGKKNDE